MCLSIHSPVFCCPCPFLTSLPHFLSLLGDRTVGGHVSWAPFMASSALVCPTVTVDVAGSFALQAMVSRLVVWMGVMFEVKGMSPSICMNGGIIILATNDTCCTGMNVKVHKMRNKYQVPWEKPHTTKMNHKCQKLSTQILSSDPYIFLSIVS